MKKLSLIFMLCGILFSSLGSKFYLDEEYNKERINLLIENTINITNKLYIVINRSYIYKTLEKKLNDSLTKIDRKSYKKAIEEINKIEYSDIKEIMLNKASSIEKELIKKENYQKKYGSKEKLVGNVTAYTAFCTDGCNGYTASGRYIGNSIYYNDKDYGKVRIVAADKSYPFGTIVRLNNLKYYGKEIYAIVLDRGGAIGKNKRAIFDLLLPNEKSANDFGVAKKVNCDILRIGY